MDGDAGMMAFRAAAKDRGVPGFEGERASIRRDVRAALINDADGAERYAHALELEAVRPAPFGEHGADRIAECGDVFKTLGDDVYPLGVEHEPIDERRGAINGFGCGDV